MHVKPQYTMPAESQAYHAGVTTHTPSVHEYVCTVKGQLTVCMHGFVSSFNTYDKQAYLLLLYMLDAVCGDLGLFAP